MLPLSPLQQGMLFHSVYDGEGADVYTVQVSVGLSGPVDADRLDRAAAALLRRHPNLRAGFWHEGVPQPVQFVPAEVTFGVERVDLTAAFPKGADGTALTGASPAERLAVLRRAELARRFAL
ncbi:hypothetical protein GTW71_33315, partial [Streptomyces sp. SID6041]|nr:hypothetical protein [Streptomyces sp. SID6041]